MEELIVDLKDLSWFDPVSKYCSDSDGIWMYLMQVLGSGHKCSLGSSSTALAAHRSCPSRRCTILRKSKSIPKAFWGAIQKAQLRVKVLCRGMPWYVSDSSYVDGPNILKRYATMQSRCCACSPERPEPRHNLQTRNASNASPALLSVHAAIPALMKTMMPLVAAPMGETKWNCLKIYIYHRTTGYNTQYFYLALSNTVISIYDSILLLFFFLLLYIYIYIGPAAKTILKSRASSTPPRSAKLRSQYLRPA